MPPLKQFSRRMQSVVITGRIAQLLNPYLITSSRRTLLLWPYRQPVDALRFGYKRRQFLPLAPAFHVKLRDPLATRPRQLRHDVNALLLDDHLHELTGAQPDLIGMAIGARQFAFNCFARLEQARLLLVIGFGDGVTRRLSRLLGRPPDCVTYSVL